MNISIIGLGYVGAVCSNCFARDGHMVIGIDVSKSKVDQINSGKSPIVEKGLDELTNKNVKSGHLRALTDLSEAVLSSDISFVCVGTPSQINGSIDLSYIYKVCQDIGTILKSKDTYHLIVIRSTVKPGTVKHCNEMIQDFSGKKIGLDFDVVSNPEFLREGTAIEDFDNPPYTVIGADSDKAFSLLSSLYEHLEGETIQLKPEEAEMIKYANNNFHAMKIIFANEIGNVCKELGVDGTNVMKVVASDFKLNLSSYYLKPGFAYGGSCLPKDVRGLNALTKDLFLTSPLLNSLNESNEYQIQRGIDLVTKHQKKKIGIMGLAFKANTDDMRESPIVAMIEYLIGKGYDLKIYDENVNLSSLLGKNKDYLITHVPHIYKLLSKDLNDVIDHAELIVIANNSVPFESINAKRGSRPIVDLVRSINETENIENYEGICW